MHTSAKQSDIRRSVPLSARTVVAAATANVRIGGTATPRSTTTRLDLDEPPGFSSDLDECFGFWLYNQPPLAPLKGRMEP